MARLISPSAVKKYTKELLAKERPKFTRVSQEFVDQVDAQLKAWIKSYVGMYTGPGKTLQASGRSGNAIPPRVQNRYVREHVFIGGEGVCKHCGKTKGEVQTEPAALQCIRRKV